MSTPKHRHDREGVLVAHLQRRDTPAGVRWVVRHSTPDGAERSKTFTTKAAARQYQTTVEASQHSGSYVDPRSGSVLFSTVADKWMAGRADLAPTTTASYETYLHAYILPTFGSTPVAKIASTDVDSWIATLANDGRARTTISKALAMVRSILELAVRDRLIPASPAAVKLRLPNAEQREMLVLTAAQVAELSDTVGVFYRTHILTAAQTGMRWGELCGLSINNVDLLRGEIHVGQQLTEIAGKLTITQRLKTAASRRTIPIGGNLAELLGEHLGRFPNDQGLVFTSVEGALLRRSNFARQVLKPAANTIGVATLRFHDLRHTHASLLLGAGEPIPIVSKRLGHKNSATTLAIYAHAIPGSERSAADTMEGMFTDLPTTVAEFRDRSDGMGTGWGDAHNVVNFPETRETPAG